MHEFELDPRLTHDTHTVLDLALSRLLLMDDARYPWLILVPRRPDVSELTQLTIGDQAMLLAEINRAAAAVREIGVVDKLNIGMLGNVVHQLHVHIVGRRADDDAWPGPVWGKGRPVRYAAADLERHLDALRHALTIPASPHSMLAN